jgi:hypothetical protein
VYAAPDLAAAVPDLEALLGVKPAPGGRHPRWGTRNALVPLGPDTYLEIIGPDDESPAAVRPTLFGIDRLTAPRLVTWAARADHLGSLATRARAHGIDLGAVTRGERERPGGTRLEWDATDPMTEREGGVIPFFIDWRDSPHPGASPDAIVSLAGFHAEHPEPGRIAALLRMLDVALEVRHGPAPALTAELRTPTGIVTLR